MESLGLKNIDFEKAKDLKVDKGSMIITVNKYKGFALPLLVIAVCILILFLIIFPEIKQYFASRNELAIESQKLDTLKNNYNFLSGLDENYWESQRKLLEAVLPTQKDFFGIITAVSAASAKAGISIGDFTFSLGNLSNVSDQSKSQFPTIQMNLTTEGDINVTNDFINRLYQTAPLVQIDSIKYSNGKANLALEFYYNPYSSNNINDDVTVSQLSAKDNNTLSNVSGWDNLLGEGGLFVLNGSSSSSGNISNNASSSSQTNFSPFQ